MDFEFILLEFRVFRLLLLEIFEIFLININFWWELINNIVSNFCFGWGFMKDREKCKICYFYIRFFFGEYRDYRYNKFKVIY